jgi:hypothetical protein
VAAWGASTCEEAGGAACDAYGAAVKGLAVSAAAAGGVVAAAVAVDVVAAAAVVAVVVVAAAVVVAERGRQRAGSRATKEE